MRSTNTRVFAIEYETASHVTFLLVKRSKQTFSAVNANVRRKLARLGFDLCSIEVRLLSDYLEVYGGVHVR